MAVAEASWAAEDWQAIACAHHHTPDPPTTPPTLGDAVQWIAQLGGFLGRRVDGDPGVTLLWIGFSRLADLTAMYSLLRSSARHATPHHTCG